MSEWKYFAHRLKETFHHVYPDARTVSMCGAQEIFPVGVREAAEGEPETHWGWWDHGRPYPSMIQMNRALLQMCFPGAIEDLETRGRGRAVRLVVRELSSNPKE
jgi:hypothetical protein